VSLKIYNILFSAYLWYSYADGKFRRAYTGLSFCKVAHVKYAVDCGDILSGNLTFLWDVKAIKKTSSICFLLNRVRLLFNFLLEYNKITAISVQPLKVPTNLPFSNFFLLKFFTKPKLAKSKMFHVKNPGRYAGPCQTRDYSSPGM
jgi:hypothetical protein